MVIFQPANVRLPEVNGVYTTHIYHLYIANWIIICYRYLPPIKGTRKLPFSEGPPVLTFRPRFFEACVDFMDRDAPLRPLVEMRRSIFTGKNGWSRWRVKRPNGEREVLSPTHVVQLPKNNSSLPLKIGRAPKGKNRISTIHFQVLC